MNEASLAIAHFDAPCLGEEPVGAQLDTLARHALWQAGFDFDHGTGHGVGSYLAVQQLWYVDPEKRAALAEAKANPSVQLDVPPLEDKYWLRRLGKLEE